MFSFKNLQNSLKQLSSNKKKIFSNVFWAICSKTITTLGVFFVGILIARHLGPSQYGLMNYVISFVTLFSIIANFGLDNIVIRELAKFPLKRDSILGSSFKLQLLLSCFAFLLCITFALVFYSDLLTFGIITIYALYLFTIPFNVIKNYFTSIVNNKYIAKSEIYRTIIGASIKIILLLLNAPIWAFVFAATLDFYLLCSGFILAYNKHVGKFHHWVWNKKYAIYLCKEAYPLALSASAIIVYQKIDQVIIKNMIGNDAVGFFATASTLLSLAVFLPDVICQTVSPLLVKIFECDNNRYLNKRQQFTNIIVWVSLGISFLVCISAFWLIKFTFGIEYLASVPILQILVWKTVGSALAASSGYIIIIENIQKWAFYRNIVGCILCVFLNLLFIPHWGIIGSAWVAIISIFFSGFFSHIFIPAYQHIFLIQMKAILWGWKDLFKIKTFLS